MTPGQTLQKPKTMPGMQPGSFPSAQALLTDSIPIRVTDKEVFSQVFGTQRKAWKTAECPGLLAGF